MKKLCLSIIVFIVLGGIGGEAIAAPDVKVVSRKTISEDYAAVMVPGRQLNAFSGKSQKHLRLYAVRRGKLEPIPFQFDGRDHQGKLVMTSYTYPRRGVDRRLSRMDELVFMAEDLGDKTAFKGAEILEIEVVNSSGETRGWAYLKYHEENPPLPPKTNYVRFIPSKDEVRSVNYRVRFNRHMHMMPQELVIISDSHETANLVGEPYMRVEIGKQGDYAYMARTEKDFSSKMIGYIDGPVRVVRKIKTALLMKFKVGGIGVLSVEVESYFYRNAFEAPIEIRFPGKIGMFGLNPKISFAYNMTREEDKDFCSYYNQHIQEGIVLDSKAPEDKKNENGKEAENTKKEEKKINAAPFKWAALTNPASGVKDAFVILSNWRNSEIDYELIRLKGDAAESVKYKCRSLVGWQTTLIKNLTNNRFSVEKQFYVVPAFNSKTIGKKIDSFWPKLKVTVNEE